MNASPAPNPLRICFFGNYDPQYIRTMVILRGLRENGCEVFECNDQRRGWRGYWSLIKQHKQLKDGYDVMLVGNSGMSRSYVVLAKLLSRKMVVWDAHFSVYEAYVYDRKVIKRFSFKGRYHWCMDWLATTLADRVYLDTKAHMEYFCQLFHSKLKKFFYIYVGADETMFSPQPPRDFDTDKFIVEFHGKYIPLQGISFIIQAAKQLESDPSIKFILIGNGQTHAADRALAEKLQVQNIEFIDKVPYVEIPRYISQADVCLGIFGSSDKTQRVIPNKLYEAVAMGKPVITARTPAIQEVFTDQKNILLCNSADANDLAVKIIMLKNMHELMRRLREEVRKLYLDNLTPSKIIAPLYLKILECRKM